MTAHTKNILADLCGDAESLLVCEMVKQELIDLHPLLFVFRSFQGKQILLSVGKFNIKY